MNQDHTVDWLRVLHALRPGGLGEFLASCVCNSAGLILCEGYQLMTAAQRIGMDLNQIVLFLKGLTPHEICKAPVALECVYGLQTNGI